MHTNASQAQLTWLQEIPTSNTYSVLTVDDATADITNATKLEKPPSRIARATSRDQQLCLKTTKRQSNKNPIKEVRTL